MLGKCVAVAALAVSMSVSACTSSNGKKPSPAPSSARASLAADARFIAVVRSAHPNIQSEGVGFSNISDDELVQLGTQVCTDARQGAIDHPNDPDFVWKNTVIGNGTLLAGQALVLARAAHSTLC